MHNPNFTLTEDSAAFLEETLSREVLCSDRRRLWLLLGFLAVALVSFVVVTYAPGLVAEALQRSFRAQAPAVLALFGVALAYEASVLAWVTRLVRSGRQPPGWARYGNAFIEISLPTATLLIAATAFGPVQALAAAPTRFYFLFIIMAALQLDARICVFSGCAAAAQYAAAAGYLLRDVDPANFPFLLTDEVHQVALAGLLLLGGLLAGFVAAQIRRQVVVALRSADDRRRTIGLFGQYVSPEVVERVLRQPVGLSGELRQVSVMFLDIRDFSVFAASHSPAEVMSHLNVVFGDMIDVVNRNQGIVNKFLGDGFMAIFGAPADDDEHCRHAVAAGFEILAAVERMNRSGAISPTRVGIGIHAGEVVTGNVGSTQRKEYTIIGDVVNLAARIEAANKQFGAQMLVSSAVRDHLDPSIRSEDLGLVELKGQPAPFRLHRLA